MLEDNNSDLHLDLCCIAFYKGFLRPVVSSFFCRAFVPVNSFEHAIYVYLHIYKVYKCPNVLLRYENDKTYPKPEIRRG